MYLIQRKEMEEFRAYLQEQESQAYFQLTKEYGITPPMSRRGNCYDNAMAEISSPFSKLSAFTGTNRKPSGRPMNALTASFTSTPMSASS